MSRHLSLILWQYLAFPLICGGSLAADGSSAMCNYNWDMQIAVVRNIMNKFAASCERGDEILLRISLLETQLSEISNKNSMPTSCVEAAAGTFKSGVYKIHLKRLSATPLEVFFTEETDFGGWLVIQRRISDSVDFNRDWQAYKDGFGDIEGNYWIGLEKLHALTSSCEHELHIEMERFNGEKLYAKYTEFVIGSESEGYALNKLGNYTGNAGDGLIYHIHMKFSTHDRDNDLYEDYNCAKYYKGAWWFKRCLYSHLNGE